MSKAKERMEARMRVIGAIMSVLVIVMLVFPAYTTWYIDDRWVNQVLAVEGLHENGTVYETYEPVDENQLTRMFSDEEFVGEEPDNDSYYLKLNSAGIKRNKFYTTDFVTYIGNGNYTCTPDYDLQTSPPTFIYREIGVPYNVTSHELAEFDFLRLYSDDEHSARYFAFERSFGYQKIAFQEVRDNTYILIMTTGLRSNLLSSPDEPVYITWNGFTPTALNESDVTWQFRFSSFVLDPEFQFFWKNEHLYIMSLIPMAIVLPIGFFFATQPIDVKWDKSKSKRKGGKR